MTTRSLEQFLELPYTFLIVHDVDEDGREGWVAEVEELPGCISQGSTPEEAIARVRDAMRDWIAVALEDGVEMPMPHASADFSGRFLVRVPASLHADLARSAGHEGVSLNSFVSSALAGAVGWRRDRPSRATKAGRRQARRPAPSQ
jgi:antitoxin HicB